MFRFRSLIIISVDSSSLRIVDWHLSNNFKLLYTLYAISIVREIVLHLFQNNLKIIEVRLFYKEGHCMRVKR